MEINPPQLATLAAIHIHQLGNISDTRLNVHVCIQKHKQHMFHCVHDYTGVEKRKTSRFVQVYVYDVVVIIY